MFYFDMDGVLAKYDYDGYKGKKPAFTDIKKHYFLDRDADFTILEVFEILYEKYSGYVKVLTTVSKERDIRNHQTFDKMHWLLRFIPDFNIGEDFIAVTTDKRDIIQKIKGMNLAPSDLLIDDYNINLEKWKEFGGTAIKYLNGINSPRSWSGDKIHFNEGSGKICEELIDIMVKSTARD